MSSDSVVAPQRDIRFLIAAVVLAVVVVVAVFALGIERPPELPSLAASDEALPTEAIAWTSWSGNEQCASVAEPDGSWQQVRCGPEGELVAFDADGPLQLLSYSGGSGRQFTLLSIDRSTGAILSTESTDRHVEYNDTQQPSWIRDGDDLVVRYDNREVWRVKSRSSYTVSSARISPDGEHIVLTDAANRIILLTVSGDEPARVWVEAERGRNRFGFNTVLWAGESLLQDPEAESAS